MTQLPPFRTGDSILHKPTGETWVCAWADPETGYLSWLGWPAGEAKISDFALARAATDEEHQKWLRDLKRSARSDVGRALRLYGDPDAEAVPSEVGFDFCPRQSAAFIAESEAVELIERLRATDPRKSPSIAASLMSTAADRLEAALAADRTEGPR